MIVCGIDPGITGALAVVNEDHDCETVEMPTAGVGKHRAVDGAGIARFMAERDVEFAIVELVHSMPRQGVASTFKFGTAYGTVLGTLHACCMPYRLVTPAKWKKDMMLSSDKRLSLEMATRRLPRAALQFARVKDHGRAEAALLALWWLENGNRFDARRAA